MLAFNKHKQPTIGEIKDITLVMCAHPYIRTTCNIQVIDMGVSNYSIILGRDWKSWTGGYYSMDGTHVIIPYAPRNIIVYKEDRIVPYIENLPEPLVNHIEDDLGFDSIFSKEESKVIPIYKPPKNYQYVWQLFFDGESSQYVNGVGILLQNDFRERNTFAFRLNFACTNNKTGLEALLLGLENALRIGYHNIQAFGYSELI